MQWPWSEVEQISVIQLNQIIPTHIQELVPKFTKDYICWVSTTFSAQWASPSAIYMAVATNANSLRVCDQKMKSRSL